MSEDQDFFFDEDEQTEEVAAEKTADKKKSAPAKPATRQSAAGYGGSSVSMTVAGLIGVVALLAGIIIGIIIPAGASVPAPTATGAGVSAPAPQLTQEQLSSGVMPEGHVPVDVPGMEVPAATDSTETTTPAE